MNPTERIEQLRDRISRRSGERDRVTADLERARGDLARAESDGVDIETAQALVQHVAKKTQEKLRFRIEELSTLALAAVFDDPYALKLEFVLRRGRSECELFFERNGERVEPTEASGVGCVDIAAFALRASLWTLRRHRSRPVLLLDEPFKHLKGDAANRLAIQMVRDVSERLGLQIIMVSDERAAASDIEAGADRVFRFSIKKRRTQVEIVK